MCKERKKSGVSIAFLCTPTDIHLCPKEAVDGAHENLHSLPVSIKFMKAATGLFGLKSMLVANVAKPVGNLHYVEGLVSAQVVQPYHFAISPPAATRHKTAPRASSLHRCLNRACTVGDINRSISHTYRAVPIGHSTNALEPYFAR